jgi:hypothetical protein
VSNDLWKPPVETPSAQALGPYRVLALVGFCAATALQGIVASEGGPILGQYIASFPMATAAVMWCTVDAASRGDYYPHSLRWATMFLWPIAVPVYLIQSRKGWGILFALLALVAMLVLQGIGHALGDAWHG